MANNTVSVDVNTLQILNDRICQTLDALNQVRWSAFANRAVNPYHTAGQYSTHPAFSGFNGFANPATPYAPAAFGPMSAFGTPATPYAPTAFAAPMTPYTQAAFGAVNAFGAPMTSYAPTAFGTGMMGSPVHNGWGFNPYVSRSDVPMNGAYPAGQVPTGI